MAGWIITQLEARGLDKFACYCCSASPAAWWWEPCIEPSNSTVAF